MNTSMTFPKTIDEFIDSYQFVDRKEVYTNGSELIPVFRVQQAIEHYLPKWISVKERLPEKDEEVIVCVQMENGMLYVTSAELWNDGLFWTDSGQLNSPRYNVTHWMQLPPPPEGGQDD